jgi:acyl carrier protein
MAEHPMEQRVCAIIAAIFNLPADSVGPSASMEALEAWDSMGHLMLTLELEQEFCVQIPPEEVEKMTSVPAICQALAKCGVSV